MRPAETTGLSVLSGPGSRPPLGFLFFLLVWSLSWGSPADASPDTLRVASWNLRNFLVADRVSDGVFLRNYPKPEAERHAVTEVILHYSPDILFLQEMGSEAYLRDLQAELSSGGLDYSHAFFCRALDPERSVAVLARQRPSRVHCHDNIPTSGSSQFQGVKRGLLEYRLELAGKEIALFTLHLKSRYTTDPSDPEAAGQRLAEAEALRNDFLSWREAGDETPWFLLGDFNDGPASAPLRRFFARGGRELFQRIAATDRRHETWTYYHQRSETYQTVDYLMQWIPPSSEVTVVRAFIGDHPSVMVASDHRILILELEKKEGLGAERQDPG